MANYTLHLGDCLEVMPTIPAGSVDAIIADWPYGTTACPWDSVIPLEPLWRECKRVIKPSGAIVLTASQPFTTVLIASSPHFGTSKKWFKYEWIWDKKAISNFQLANVMPLRRHESIVVFCAGTLGYCPQMKLKDKPIDKRNWSLKSKRQDALGHLGSKTLEPGKKILTHSFPTSIIEINSCDAECNGLHRLHPTQKPVALMEYLIKTYTNPGDLVLDNTMGSGSTGEACLRTERQFIGIEKDKGYFEIAQNRLERVEQELRQAQIAKERQPYLMAEVA